MKRKLILFIWLFAMFLSSLASAITKEEIITLSKLGIGDDEIIKAIDKDRTIFILKIQDILELKKSGVSENVIKYMLATPQKFGKVAPAPAPAPAPVPVPGEIKKAGPPAPPREKTPEEIAAEEEKKREEARKLQEESKKAEEAKKKAYARGVMRRGQELAQTGNYVEAIKVFETFVKDGNYGPGTEEFYFSRYGIAKALAQAGLIQSAARSLVDVLLEGPDKPFFQSAFRELRALRKKIIYNPPDLEELTKFFIGNFSKQFQDEYNYMLGEYFYDLQNYQKALKYFEQVAETSDEKAKALYLTGLIQVNHKMYKSAVESFQQAVMTAEKNKSGDDIIELSYLALARVGFEHNNFDAAIYYYRKIPKTSSRLPIAFFESAWTFFMKGDFSRALGTFNALHSPYFSHYFYPELWILEATVYLNICHYDQAKKALQMFDTDVAAIGEPLKRFITINKTPEDFYQSFIDSANGKTTQGVPKQLSLPVLANISFYNVYRTIRQIESEEKEIGKNVIKLGPFGESLVEKLKLLKKDKITYAGLQVQKILRQLDADISELLVKVTEIEVDISAVEIEKRTEEIRELVGEAGEKVSEEKVKEGNIAIVGGDTQEWPFESDFWLDEIGSYRSFLKDECK
jgi:tetratricopeptide (TPR) repeat protein